MTQIISSICLLIAAIGLCVMIACAVYNERLVRPKTTVPIGLLIFFAHMVIYLIALGQIVDQPTHDKMYQKGYKDGVKNSVVQKIEQIRIVVPCESGE